MTAETTLTTDPGSSEPTRSFALLVGAAALVSVVVVLVLVYGVARPPELVPLVERPDPGPTASVAWSEHDRDEPCLFVATPEGTDRELACIDDLGEIVAWDDDGIVVRTWMAGDELRRLDPATGEELGIEEPNEAGDLRTHRPSQVVSRTRNGVLRVVLDDTDQVLWETEADDPYRVQSGSVSPDGDWVAMVDSADRLLVVPSDGSEPPRIWVEDVGSWEAPVWEGTRIADLRS